ncbi:hypothetical protein H4Q26_000778 [Puccinia striiformis f. sp. tritici PST-130]|nr:hypothetical protein H4Q26_000778 [Puccinia striiformis f. sp. tritici PST-130]
MVASLRTTSRGSRVSAESAPNLTPILLRKSRKALKTKYVTDILSQDNGVFGIEATHQRLLHDVRRLALVSSGLLRVPLKDPIRPLALQSTGGPVGKSQSFGKFNGPNPTTHWAGQDINLAPDRGRIVFLDPRGDCPPTRGAVNPSDRMWLDARLGAQSCSSGLRSAKNSKSLRSTNVSFYSARESPKSSIDGVISKDFAVPQFEYFPLTDQPAEADLNHRSLYGGSLVSSSCNDRGSTIDDSTEGSFHCRGLSSSQFTPTSRSHLSARSQPSNRSQLSSCSQPSHRSQPSNFRQRSDRFQLSSLGSLERSDPGLRFLKQTNLHPIMDCCNQSDQSPSPASGLDLRKDQSHENLTFDVSRTLVSKSKDQPAIEKTDKHPPTSENSSRTTDPITAIIPANTNPQEDGSIFKCALMRRIIKTFGPDMVVWNDKRKKFLNDLRATLRRKFRHGLYKRA